MEREREKIEIPKEPYSLSGKNKHAVTHRQSINTGEKGQLSIRTRKKALQGRKNRIKRTAKNGESSTVTQL